MKENFAYSRRMHYETAVKPARHKSAREMSVAIAMVATLVAGAVSPAFSAWMLDHAGAILLASIMVWAACQMSQDQRDA